MLKFAPGTVLQWRYPDEKEFYAAAFESQSEGLLILRMLDMPDKLPVRGREVVLRVDINDFYTEVLKSSDGVMMELKPVLNEQRRYFRVDDYFPVTARKVEAEKAEHSRSRVIPVFGFESAPIEVPNLDDGDLIRLWRALSGLNNKMSIIAYYLEVTPEPIPERAEKIQQVMKLVEQADFRLASVMDELGISKYRLARAENKRINISATGVRFITHEPLAEGDYVEIKLLLPTSPPTGIITHTRAVRVEDLGRGRYDVALDFASMDAAVQDFIIRYAMDRQRDLLKQRRGQGG